MKVTLSKPPSLNHYWRFTSRPFPHWYISAAGKAYREEAGWLLKKAMGRRKTLTGEVKVSADLYWCRHVDLDNILKVVLDTLTSAQVITDDKQVASIVLHRYKVPKMLEERLEVEVVAL